MKKILSFIFCAFLISGCNSENESFKGYEYEMVSAPNDATITLAFDADEDRFFGRVVNNYFGTYTLDGNKITFGPAASTMMFGEESAMQAEYIYLQNILPNIKTYAATKDGLTFTLENGDKVEFKKLGEFKK